MFLPSSLPSSSLSQGPFQCLAEDISSETKLRDPFLSRSLPRGRGQGTPSCAVLGHLPDPRQQIVGHIHSACNSVERGYKHWVGEGAEGAGRGSKDVCAVLPNKDRGQMLYVLVRDPSAMGWTRKDLLINGKKLIPLGVCT